MRNRHQEKRTGVRGGRGALGARMVLGASLVLAGCGGEGLEGGDGFEEPIDEIAEPILGGGSVSVATRRNMGLVDVGWSTTLDTTSCSGAIINSRWVLTAVGCATASPGGGASFVVRAPRATTGSDLRNVRSKIQLNNTSLLMLELEPTVPSTWPSVTRSLYGSAPSTLQGQSITCFGRGDNAYGPGGTIGSGPWTTITKTVTSTDANDVQITANNGLDIPAADDMGGPCFRGTSLVGPIKFVTTVCNPACVVTGATIGVVGTNHWAADGMTQGSIPMLRQRNSSLYPGEHLSYRTWDGTQWCARAYGESTFAHAPNCNWMGTSATGLAKTSLMLNYKGWDNVDWSANLVEPYGFEHNPRSDPEDEHYDFIINHKNATGDNWTGRIAYLLEVTTPGGGTDEIHHIAYRDWSNSNWCASIHDKKFMHAPNCDWQNAHLADYIAYKTHDGTNWSATVDGAIFRHTPEGGGSEVVSTILNYKNHENQARTMQLWQ